MTFTEAEARRAREDFPSLGRTPPEGDGRPLAFLDGPAGTQVPEAVIGAISRYYRTSNANTHGRFVTSRESDAAVLEARGERRKALSFRAERSGVEKPGRGAPDAC